MAPKLQLAHRSLSTAITSHVSPLSSPRHAATQAPAAAKRGLSYFAANQPPYNGMPRATQGSVSTLVTPSVDWAAANTRPEARARRARQALGCELGQRSAQDLSDHELLESVLTLVLGKRSKRSCTPRETATSLLNQLHGVGGLAERLHACTLSAEQLSRLATIIELGRRVCRSPLTGRQLKSHDEVQAWATGRLTDLEHEEVWVLAVASSSRVIAEWCVGRGGLHGCGLLPSDILRPTLRSGAPALVLVHNHPSGDPTPSREDVVMTKTLHQACKTVGVILLDHVIVSRNGSHSLAESGLY